MVDQISEDRLDIGFGQGASPIEAAYFGNDHAEAEQTYRKNLDRILAALAGDSFDGKGTFNEVDEVPLLVEPYQPHPPLWYSAHSTDSATRAARMGSNIVSLDTAEETRDFADTFRDVWMDEHGSLEDLPLIGLGIFVHVDEDETRAQATASRAYAVWHDGFNWLFRRHDMAIPSISDRRISTAWRNRAARLPGPRTRSARSLANGWPPRQPAIWSARSRSEICQPRKHSAQSAYSANR